MGASRGKEDLGRRDTSGRRHYVHCRHISDYVVPTGRDGLGVYRSGSSRYVEILLAQEEAPKCLKVKHHSAILDERGVGALLRAIDGFDGQPLTSIALKLTPHLFVRPGELRKAEWPEFDFDRRVWIIPAARMKMREPHQVPLSRQALELLQSAHGLSSRQKFAFSSLYPGNRPMSENTINAALRRLGYSGSEMTAHG